MIMKLNKFLNKKKNQRNLVIAVILIVISGYFLTTTFTVFNTQENLGRWNIKYYDSSSKTAKIYIDMNVPYSGGLGVQNIYRLGTPAFTNKIDCESFGFNWKENPEDVLENGYRCVLRDENWLEDKTYVSNIRCSHTRPIGASDTVFDSDNPLYFDGLVIRFRNLKRQGDDEVKCTGTITISKKIEIKETEEIEISEKTETEKIVEKIVEEKITEIEETTNQEITEEEKTEVIKEITQKVGDTTNETEIEEVVNKEIGIELSIFETWYFWALILGIILVGGYYLLKKLK